MPDLSAWIVWKPRLILATVIPSDGNAPQNKGNYHE
jgi:hypothetical protein